MKLTKRQLNKQLKSKVLIPFHQNSEYIRNSKIRVIRARNKEVGYRREEKCMVTIQVCAQVQNTLGDWRGVQHYGPRTIRNFLRRNSSGVIDEVSGWVRLWGFSSDVYLETIELLPS
tara:strand:+ start:92 stop:442 length:351 start_codon:yes stop_codon:yes gene_type:complete